MEEDKTVAPSESAPEPQPEPAPVEPMPEAPEVTPFSELMSTEFHRPESSERGGLILEQPHTLSSPQSDQPVSPEEEAQT